MVSRRGSGQFHREHARQQRRSRLGCRAQHVPEYATMNRSVLAVLAVLTLVLMMMATQIVPSPSRSQGRVETAQQAVRFEYDVLPGLQDPRTDSEGNPVWDVPINLKLTCGWHDASPGCLTYWQWRLTCSSGETEFEGGFRGEWRKNDVGESVWVPGDEVARRDAVAWRSGNCPAGDSASPVITKHVSASLWNAIDLSPGGVTKRPVYAAIRAVKAGNGGKAVIGEIIDVPHALGVIDSSETRCRKIRVDVLGQRGDVYHKLYYYHTLPLRIDNPRVQVELPTVEGGRQSDAARDCRSYADCRREAVEAR